MLHTLTQWSAFWCVFVLHHPEPFIFELKPHWFSLTLKISIFNHGLSYGWKWSFHQWPVVQNVKDTSNLNVLNIRPIHYYRVRNFIEDNLIFDFDGIDKNYFLQNWYVYIARSDTCLSKQSWMKNGCLYILLMVHWFYLRQPFSETFICLFLSIAESKYNLLSYIRIYL